MTSAGPANASPTEWSSADNDPHLIRSYHHPDDGCYLLGADVVAWLRNLAQTARGGDPLSGLVNAPLLDRMAETVERWLAVLPEGKSE